MAGSGPFQLQANPYKTDQRRSSNINDKPSAPVAILSVRLRSRKRNRPAHAQRYDLFEPDALRVLGARDEEISPQSIDWSSDRSPNFTIRQDSGGFNALGNSQSTSRKH
jgi:L,D-transpeptidase YcbB